MYGKLFIPIILAVIAFYFNNSIFYSVLEFFTLSSSSKKTQNKLFTHQELKLYNGIDKPELHLSIMGQVFDVSKGFDHYGPGKSYNIFVGRDASRSFITGKFSEDDVSDKIADLSQDDLRSLNNWIQFYNKQYKKVGKLIGRYFNEDGKLTPYGREVKKLIKAAEKAKETEEIKKIKFPPCNVEWDPQRGTRVWCTNKSGGIDRDWEGVPRQLFEPGSQNQRCACIKPEDQYLTNLKQYEGCNSESSSCYINS